jgi:methyl-accepting chemotaxis protein
MLAKLKIAQKIYVLGFTLFTLTLIMGFTAYTQMAKIGIELVDIAEEDIPLGRALTKISGHQMSQYILFERAMLHAVLVKQNILGAHSDLSALISKIDTLGEELTKEIQASQEFVKQAIKKIHNVKGIEKFKLVQGQLAVTEQTYKKINRQLKEVLALAQQGEIQQMTGQAYSLEKVQDELTNTLLVLLEDIQKFTLEASLQAEHDEKSGIKLIVITLALALGVGLVLPFIIARSITKPINYLVSRLKEVADGDGDLTVTLNESASDETGDVARAFNKFLSALRVLISTSTQQAKVLGESSETAMTIMGETVANIDKQRMETDMVATAVTEMSTATQDVARSANHAADVTKVVRMRVTEGQQGADETQAIIKQLADEVTHAEKVIKNLVEETNKIGSVLESIQRIAGQTNLLALNAAIEAARAGESGRGFAVVADEVRSLAQHTQTSTVDIQALVERLQAEADNAVTSMHKGSESANLCLIKSSETSKTFLAAAEAVDEISSLNIQIAAAAEEQSMVAEEINKNLLNISHLAEITTEGAHATSDANTTIVKRVVELHSSLSAYVV